MAALSSKVKAWLGEPHVEVTLRMSLTTTLAYAFTMWNEPIVTPINMGLLLGILAPFLVMLLPTLIFSFGSNTLPTFQTMLFSCVSSTLMFAVAVAGGNAAFVATYAVWAFWVSFLRWDKGQGSKVGILFIMVILQTVLAWPNIDTVQNGFVVPSPSFRPAANEALAGYLEETVSEAIGLGVGTHVLSVESGVLAGRDVDVTIGEDGTSATHVAGGMWLVSGMWTFTGVTNPLAAHQNLLIVTCWTIVFVGMAALAPPFRTVRSALWRRMLPATLRDAASLLRLHVDQVTTEEGREDAPTASDGEVAQEVKAKIDALRKKCVGHMNSLFDARLARLAAFEPQLRNCKAPGNSPACLAELSVAAARLASASSGVQTFTGREFSFRYMEQYKQAATNLDICADALAKADASLLEGVDLGDTDHCDAFTMQKRTAKAVEVSKRWLRAMSSDGHANDGAERCTPNSMAYLHPWLNAHISMYRFLLSFLLAPFKRSTWKALFDRDSYALTMLVWNIKYALGMTVCIIVSFYWPAFRNDFVVASADDALRSELAIRNGGWVIVSYCFATTQTAEGSVKKGVLRAVGTAAGAFSAWLALVACEDSSSETQYNSYGIVAWMSVTTTIAIYLATQRGFAARISLVNEYSFGLIYFIITQVIIVCNVVLTYGPQGRDGVIVNRVVANLVGIAMSMVLAVLPPGLYGGDPGHVLKINHFHLRSLEATLEYLVSCEVPDDKDSATECEQYLERLSDNTLANAAKLQELTIDFMKDATRLNKYFPLFKVDPKLMPILGGVTRDVYVVTFIPLLASRIMKSEEGRSLLLKKDGDLQNVLSDILADVKSSRSSGSSEGKFPMASADDLSEGVRDDLNLLVMAIRWLLERIDRHRRSLEDIQWGCWRKR